MKGSTSEMKIVVELFVFFSYDRNENCRVDNKDLSDPQLYAVRYDSDNEIIIRLRFLP